MARATGTVASVTARDNSRSSRWSRAYFVQQRRDVQVLDVVIRQLELPRDRRGHLRHAVAVPLLSVLRGLDVIRQELERREVSVLHVPEPRRALLGETSHHVTREDQEPAPRHEGE